MNGSLKIRVAFFFLLSSLAFTGFASADDVADTAKTDTSEVKPAEAPVEEPVVAEGEKVQEEKPSVFNPAKKETDGGKLFLVAYMVFWLLPLYLLWITSRRIRRLEDDLSDLRALLPSDERAEG